jgi:hypothetical protein
VAGINISMNPLKIAIFDEIRRTFEKSSSLTNEQLNGIMFRSMDSLRLSKTGFILLQTIFTAYPFDIPYTLKSKHQLAMAKMVFPYYISPTKLVLFSDMDASIIMMSGGIEQFLESTLHFDN